MPLISWRSNRSHRRRVLRNAYSRKILATASANLLGYWPLTEHTGTNADNAEGTAARDGTYTGVTLAGTTFLDGSPAGTWDGTNDYCDVYSANLNGVFNGAEGSAIIWHKVSGAGVWTDSTERRLLNFGVDGDNFVNIFKSTSNNRIDYLREGGNTRETVLLTSHSPLGWTLYGVTWSESGDKVIAYVNGVQTGSTQATLGTWTGSLGSTINTLGAGSTGPSAVVDGHVAHPAVWSTPLNAAQMLGLKTV